LENMIQRNFLTRLLEMIATINHQFRIKAEHISRLAEELQVNGMIDIGKF